MSDDASRPKRASPESKAQNLLRRFPVLDLSYAIDLNRVGREAFLKHFVETFTLKSYVPTREACAMIYGAQKPLFSMGREPWVSVENYLKATAPKHILDMNIDAAKVLFELVRPKGYAATECDPQVLRVRLKQVVNIGLGFYITEGERLVFQYPQLRKSYLSDSTIAVLGSIIHHAYAQGDFDSAEIEVADISCLEPGGKREGRIRTVPSSTILSREALTEKIDEVYDLLWHIARRTGG